MPYSPNTNPPLNPPAEAMMAAPPATVQSMTDMERNEPVTPENAQGKMMEEKNIKANKAIDDYNE